MEKGKMIRKLLIPVILIAIVCSGVLASGCVETRLFQDVSPQEAFNLIEDNKDSADFIILDVRRASEYQEGHLKNSINLDYYASDFAVELDKLDKGKSYLVYCHSGNRSSGATKMMEELGFEKIYNMLGGISAWQDEGFPVIK